VARFAAGPLFLGECAAIPGRALQEDIDYPAPRQLAEQPFNDWLDLCRESSQPVSESGSRA